MPTNGEKMAGIRTQLANERTFMACVRTQMALMGGGVALIHIYDHILLFSLGCLLCVSGLVVFGVGLKNYLKVRKVVAAQAELKLRELGLG